MEATQARVAEAERQAAEAQQWTDEKQEETP